MMNLIFAGLVVSTTMSPLYRPKSLDEVVATLPAASLAPRPVATATDKVALARYYVELGRKSGDPRYYGHAQAALAQWWDVMDAPADVLLLRAHVLQFEHHFTLALRDLETYLVQRPGDAEARLMEATLLFVTAQYERAAKSCAALTDLQRIVCTAQVKGMTGKAGEGYADVQQALRDAPADPLKSWALGIAGELAARAGKTAEASTAFEQALWANPHDVFILATYTDFLYDQGADSRALQLLTPHTENDGLLIRLTRVEKRLGKPEAAAHAQELAKRFAAQRERGTARHQREEAMYKLWITGETEEALRLATENFELQREPVDARLLEDARKARGVLR